MTAPSISDLCRQLIDGLLEAVWLVDASTLHILQVNSAACELQGLSSDTMLGRHVLDLTASPEDQVFWEEVATGLSQSICSETLIKTHDGEAVNVERRVSKVWLQANQAVYLVGIVDMRRQHSAERQLALSLSELQATLESTADAILVTLPDGDIQNYNRNFAALWCLPEDVLRKPDAAALYDHMASLMPDAASYRARLADIAADPLATSEDVLWLANGKVVERFSRAQHHRGIATGRVYSFRDISQRVDAESKLRLAAKVFDTSLDAIFITDTHYAVVASNPACEKLTGYAQAQLMGMRPGALFKDAHDSGWFERVVSEMTGPGYWQGRTAMKRVDGSSCQVQLSWVQLHDEHAKLQQTIVFFKDLTDELAAQQRIEHLAYRDALTGLPNRLLLSQRVEFALRIAERNGGTFCIFFIDLDRFKNINDSMGHAFGDRVLIDVSERIRNCLREVDTLSRLGGDEFVIFLQDMDMHGAEVLAHRLLATISQPFLIEGMSFSLGCSIGISLYPEDGRTLDELIKCADSAMYLVKERGRGSFRFYQPQMNVDLLSRMKLDHAMRLAMAKNEFKLFFQPQISLASGELIAAEALIRWKDATMGNIAPDMFIPLAEETGFIISIGQWVLQEAVRQAAVWQNQGQPLVVSINVSALQFQQTNFVDNVRDALTAANLAPQWLELELTESILLKDANDALARLHALAKLGVGMSIDDFGTGYSSLAYLKQFPLAKLKIDRSFVTGLQGDESDRAIVSATVGMASGLRLKVVAEGVETEAQRHYLADLGCTSYQGFLCSPALPADEFDDLRQRLP